MFRAILLEDEMQTRDYLVKRLTEQFHCQNEELCISAYGEGRKVLQALSEHYHYDVLLLDIEMPGMDGITLAKRIREDRPDIPLVFISGHDSLVFNTFEVQPFRFIRKETFDEQLPRLVSALIQKLNDAQRRTFYLTEASTGDIYSFDVTELLYIEAQRKECRLVSLSGETLLRCPFSHLERQTKERGFLKCHRSYLVNWRSIFVIGKSTLKLINGDEIPLSRGLSSQVRQAYMKSVAAEA